LAATNLKTIARVKHLRRDGRWQRAWWSNYFSCGREYVGKWWEESTIRMDGRMEVTVCMS